MELIHWICNDLEEVFFRFITLNSTCLICIDKCICINSVRCYNTNWNISICKNTKCVVHLNAADFSSLLNCPCYKLLEKSCSLWICVNNETKVIKFAFVTEFIDNRIDCIVNCICSVFEWIS